MAVIYFILLMLIILSVALGVAAIAVSLILVRISMRMVKNAKMTVKKIDEKTKAKFNKIATMTVPELDDYLTKVYTGSLEVTIMKDISPKDPNNAVILFAKSLEYMHIYLGQETITAIEYYYGKGYIDKWCKLRYQLLESGGQLAALMNKHHHQLAESIE